MIGLNKTPEANQVMPLFQTAMQKTSLGHSIPKNLQEEVEKSKKIYYDRVYTIIISNSELKTGIVSVLMSNTRKVEVKSLFLKLKSEYEAFKKALESEKAKDVYEIAFMMNNSTGSSNNDLASSVQKLNEKEIRNLVLEIGNGEIYKNLQFLPSYRAIISEKPDLSDFCLKRTNQCAQRALEHVNSLEQNESGSYLNVHKIETHARLEKLRKSLSLGLCDISDVNEEHNLSTIKLSCDIFSAMGEYLRTGKSEFSIDGKTEYLMDCTTIYLKIAPEINKHPEFAKILIEGAVAHAEWEKRLKGQEAFEKYLRKRNDDGAFENIFSNALVERLELEFAQNSDSIPPEAYKRVEELLELRKKFISALVVFWKFIDESDKIQPLVEKYIQPRPLEQKFLEQYAVALLES